MQVVVVGTGLIGASLGLALRQLEEVDAVVGIDISETNLRTAREAGAIDRGVLTADAAAVVPTADLLVLAVPPSAIAATAAELVPLMQPGATLTDVASVKRDIVDAMEQSAPPGVHVIGGHPMAGSHEHGPAHATKDLFVGATYLLTPTRRTERPALAALQALISQLGARVVVVDPAEHDQLVAVISHLPQLTATTLMTLAAERARRDDARLLLLAAGGFRDATRVAASNPEMWLDICRENRDAIVSVLDEYAARIGQLRMMLFESDEERLTRLLTDAREARRTLPGKESVSGQLVELRVTIPDRPGALADITGTLAHAGINIEDLGMEHAPEGGRGTLRMAVNGLEAAQKAHASLSAAGYEPLERAS